MPNESLKRPWSFPPVSPAAEGPLHQQVADGVRQAVSGGRLKPGDLLPSFRALAEELLVSLITVKRAYSDLEQEGIIVRKQGLGTFVAEDGLARCQGVKQQRAERLLHQAIREGYESGLSKAELIRLTRKIIERGDGEE
ncbi:MAG: GntR family transcriptional regulator [bacterium]|nr:GntR family transcriptional regulator [bacterium]